MIWYYEVEKRTLVFYRNWATRVSVKRADYQTHAGSIKQLKVIKMIRHYEGVGMPVQSSTRVVY